MPRATGQDRNYRLTPIDFGRDVMACELCEQETLRKDLLDDGETCPHCRLVGGLWFTGRNAL